MSHKFLLNASFHSLLNAIDQELAEQALKKGCSHCGGKLHQADYPRSPFGIPQPFYVATMNNVLAFVAVIVAEGQPHHQLDSLGGDGSPHHC